LVLAPGEPSQEEFAWLGVDGPKECRPKVAELAARIEEALIGRRDSTASAFVTITESTGGYRVDLQVQREGTATDSKLIVAADCHEAVRAAALVLALALGELESAPADDTSARSDQSSPAATLRGDVPEVGSRVWVTSQGAPIADRPLDREPPEPEEHRLRAALSTGIDVGTLPAPTAQVGLGVTVLFQSLEARGVVRYGLPQEHETRESEFFESRRAQFGTAEVGVCGGHGSSWNVSVCAGGELSVVYENRRTAAEAGSDVDTDQLTPRLAGVLTALVAHRAGFIQPQLEASGVALGWGREASAPWVALRLGAGASLQF
jgi:hypothetical protein